jgi:hypothetical protein
VEQPRDLTTTQVSGPGGIRTGYSTFVLDNDGLCLDSYGDTSNAGGDHRPVGL